MNGEKDKCVRIEISSTTTTLETPATIRLRSCGAKGDNEVYFYLVQSYGYKESSNRSGGKAYHFPETGHPVRPMKIAK